MSWGDRRSVRVEAAALLLALFVAAPARGEGSAARFTGLSLTWEVYRGGDHLFSTDAIDGQSTFGYAAEGRRWDLGTTTAQSFHAAADLALPGALEARLGASWVVTSYDGNAPIDLEVDDGALHGYLQDARITVRRRFDLDLYQWAPSLGVSFPLTDYPVDGHAAPGNGFVAVQGGLEVVRGLGAYASFGEVAVDASYAQVANVEEEDLNLFEAGAGIGWYTTRRTTIRLIGRFASVLGGVDWVSASGGPSIHGSGTGTGLDSRLAATRLAWAGAAFEHDWNARWGMGVGLYRVVWGENAEEGWRLALTLHRGFPGARAPN